MLYDVAVKRAERLLRKNWASVQREAHRLAAEGLPITVDAQFIEIDGPDYCVIVRSTGEVEKIWPNGQTYDGNKGDVARVLQAILQNRQLLARQAGAILEELKKV